MTKAEWVSKVNEAIARSALAVETGTSATLANGRIEYLDLYARLGTARRISFSDVCKKLNGSDIRSLKMTRAG